MTYYILNDGGQVTEVADIHAWGNWYAKNPDARRVDKTEIGDVEVSTVFLAIDHNHWGGAPLLFETMVFGGEYDQSGWRWSTREQAQAGHDAVVAALREGRDPNVAVSR